MQKYAVTLSASPLATDTKTGLPAKIKIPPSLAAQRDSEYKAI